ncbi:hypothetical protein [Heyndrickxia camelliae]|uniref:Uncharacterized protein n=1 Tax=Heyndrickxia camelliae TaxID=1707093 RepID=A0A2N3LEB1_9BACI|nr:hypothetical protein [Heyndrickxia camelliae]PKR82874.1 hypothetical protein CWO92_22045 [Heyndrickxia camelliae]
MFTSTGIAFLAIKIFAIGAAGISASTFMDTFHNFKFKSKKKGDNDVNVESESLREKAKSIR